MPDVPDTKKLERQIAHIKQHRDAFDKVTLNQGWSPERYFAHYVYAYPNLYKRLCAEMGIESKHE